MFSSFLDSKVLSRWADQEPLQRVFDGRLEREHLYDTFEDDPGNRRYRKCSVLHKSGGWVTAGCGNWIQGCYSSTHISIIMIIIIIVIIANCIRWASPPVLLSLGHVH